MTDAADQTKRLYPMMGDGVAELKDILRKRIVSIKLDRDRGQTALDRIRTKAIPVAEIPRK